MNFARPDILLGPSIILEPLSVAHRESLRIASEGDDAIWTYFPVNFNGSGEDFDPWFDYTLARSQEATHYPFAVRRRESKQVIGTTRFYDMSFDHRRLAIGSTWYNKQARGTLVNSEVRLLTLSHAFERMQANRVELITDPRNLNSRAAMRILGAVQEGVLRNHMIYKDGRIRDSIVFSIIKEEWPAVRARLLEKLGYTTEQLQF
jgi:RimJ/RimL family protein N-acetyltransferase